MRESSTPHTNRIWKYTMKLLQDIRQIASKGVTALDNKMSDNKFLVILAIFVGMISGFGAALLKDLITWLSNVVKDVFPADHYNVLFLVLPVIGIVICTLYSRYVVKQDMEFGCERIHQNLVNKNYRLPRSISYAPIVACSLTIGFGGSAGSEGPIAYAGAGIGSNVGKYFGLNDETLRILVIIGAAAGIAGIFKAPVGGAMFALEVLAMPMNTFTITALMFSCLAAACVAYAWSGFTIDIAYMPKNFFDPGMTLGVVMLGIFCALYSIYYNYAMHRTEKVFASIKSIWVKNVVSGLLVGVLIFIFPVLYGEGYGVLNDIINGNNTDVMRDTILFNAHGPWVLIFFVAGTLLVKSIATAATNSGGGVGGDFAPTLFAGCMGGLLFAYFSNHMLGTHFDVANFALFGMAGVMAGTIQAPLMAIFLTLEMVGDFAMFFPLSICALISYACVRLIHRHAILNLLPSWKHHALHKSAGIQPTKS